LIATIVSILQLATSHSPFACHWLEELPKVGFQHFIATTPVDKDASIHTSFYGLAERMWTRHYEANAEAASIQFHVVVATLSLQLPTSAGLSVL